MTFSNKYSPKEIGQMEVKLKDIYKTVGLIIGLISVVITYKEELKTINYKNKEDIQTLKNNQSKQEEIIKENTNKIKDLQSDVKILEVKLQFK